MKVITDNRDGWTTQVECHDCKSVLEIDENDLKRGLFGGNYAESGTHRFYVECPLCDADVSFKSGELPRYIERATEKRVPRPK
jgi:hypothetical protein